MRNPAAAFREPQGLYYHTLALAYALSAYVLGLVGIFSESWLINVPSVLVLAHGLIISAYLIHECAHNTIFREVEDNARLGRFLNWIAGTAYGTYEDIRMKHFRHHVDVDDIAWFDYVAFFEKHPRLLKFVKQCEWAYIPAHEIVMHTFMLLAPFIIPERRDQRLRTTLVILARGGVFLAVAWYFPRAALLYVLAYLLMLTVLRFMDAIQHDYSYNLILYDKTAPSPFRGNLEHEQEHTFSNPASLKHIVLNWLTLNFGFHNAHHSRPTTPWYRLPELHFQMFGKDPDKVIPLASQLKLFHRHRLARVLERGGELDDRPKPQGAAYLKAAQQASVYGGNAASFLTSF